MPGHIHKQGSIGESLYVVGGVFVLSGVLSGLVVSLGVLSTLSRRHEWIE